LGTNNNNRHTQPPYDVDKRCRPSSTGPNFFVFCFFFLFSFALFIVLLAYSSCPRFLRGDAQHSPKGAQWKRFLGRLALSTSLQINRKVFKSGRTQSNAGILTALIYRWRKRKQRKRQRRENYMKVIKLRRNLICVGFKARKRGSIDEVLTTCRF
jgi:hypothetical protein